MDNTDKFLHLHQTTFETLVRRINGELLAGQNRETKELLSRVSLAYSPSFAPELTVASDHRGTLLRFNAGLLGGLTTINTLLMGSVASPETGDRPLIPYPAILATALSLASTYFQPKPWTGYFDSEPIPFDHPYTHAVNALYAGQVSFILAHEYGHIILGHGPTDISLVGTSTRSRSVVAMTMPDVTRMHQQEADADHLAAKMCVEYLAEHDHYLWKDLGLIGPAVLLQWLAFFESAVGALFLKPWLSELFNILITQQTDSGETGENIYIGLHGHPLGSDRARAYWDKVPQAQLSDFTKGMVDANGFLIEQMLEQIKDRGRLEKALGVSDGGASHDK